MMNNKSLKNKKNIYLQYKAELDLLKSTNFFKIYKKISDVKNYIKKTNFKTQENTNIDKKIDSIKEEINKINNSKFLKIWNFSIYTKNIIINENNIRTRILNKASIQTYLFFNDKNKYYFNKNYSKALKNKIFINSLNLNQNLIESNNKIDIIIPWYGDENIYKLLESIFKNDFDLVRKIFLINDSYPDKTKNNKLEKHINNLSNKKIEYIKQDSNKGFIKTVNNGFARIKTNCIILNTDTIVTKNWLKKIIDIANKDKLIATITPFSNNATVFSVPNFLVPNIDDDFETTNSICEKVTLNDYIDVPTGHGFCMYIRKEYLDKYGFFDEITYGTGYGEENDLCMRFSKNGLKNVCATNTYIAHLESQSFGDNKRKEQIKNNYPKLLSKYPEYDYLIQNFIKNNPFRDSLELIKYFKSNIDSINKETVLIINHTDPFDVIGGVEIETKHIVDHIKKEHPNKNILVYCKNIKTKNFNIIEIKNDSVKIFEINKDIDPKSILEWIIRVYKIKLCIIEHLINHSLEYAQILKESKIKSILFIHDFYYYCLIPDLINNKNNFCNFETDNSVCINCIKEKLKHGDIENHRNLSKKLFTNNYFESIIFNSEFTLDIYKKLYNLEDNKIFTISYPE